MVMKLNFKTIKASEFKAKCLKLMDQVASSGQELVITKNQKPIAKLTPYRQRPKTLLGIDKGKIEITGDIVSPVEADWKVDSSRDWGDLT